MANGGLVRTPIFWTLDLTNTEMKTTIEFISD